VSEAAPPPPGGPENPVQPVNYPYAAQPRYPEGTWAGHQLASWWGRVGATLLDSVFIVLLIAAAIGAGVALGAATTDAAGIPFYILAALIWLFYAPFLMAREGGGNGQTWGKQIVGIRVVREDQRPMAFGWSFLREFVIKTVVFQWIGGSLLIGGLLDLLWPLWDNENRALHDMLATTRVVQT
jgi:uncharacterized RDD family membrane protein YckC